jgi:hypothetical protein
MTKIQEDEILREYTEDLIRDVDDFNDELSIEPYRQRWEILKQEEE